MCIWNLRWKTSSRSVASLTRRRRRPKAPTAESQLGPGSLRECACACRRPRACFLRPARLIRLGMSAPLQATGAGKGRGLRERGGAHAAVSRLAPKRPGAGRGGASVRRAERAGACTAAARCVPSSPCAPLAAFLSPRFPGAPDRAREPFAAPWSWRITSPKPRALPRCSKKEPK